MAYKVNPFLERMSEQTTSEQEFVRLFSAKVLSQLDDAAFQTGISLYTSSPGGGKTTLLRALTPPALKAFWHTRHLNEPSEAYTTLLDRAAIDEDSGPTLLGVLLTCTSGYADLPRAATDAGDGLFRALLDCRIVLRTLRSLAYFLEPEVEDWSKHIKLTYTELGRELKFISSHMDCEELLAWAEKQERAVYADLDMIVRDREAQLPAAHRFEGVLWLEAVRFYKRDGTEIAPKRLLMIDDLQKLRKKQRRLLITELTEMRPQISIWLAERRIALGEELLSQGLRLGRELREYALEDLWGGGKNQFGSFAQNVLDKRLQAQDVIQGATFAQFLRNDLTSTDAKNLVAAAIDRVRTDLKRYISHERYSEWLSHAETVSRQSSLDTLKELYSTRILITRDLAKKQLTLGLTPLAAEEIEDRHSPNISAAAELFAASESSMPYFYGIERLCLAATNNIEELLGIAAELYDGIRTKRLKRIRDLQLSPQEQDKLFRDFAKKKRDFIPRNHTEGTRAQRLLDAMGSLCREKTYLPNAPYAPGVTGLRLSTTELDIMTRTSAEDFSITRRVLSECVAENLLVMKPSSASSGREAGTIFYLSRILCVHYSLPLQYGGWQDVTVEDFHTWMERGRVPRKVLDGI